MASNSQAPRFTVLDRIPLVLRFYAESHANTKLAIVLLAALILLTPIAHGTNTTSGFISGPTAGHKKIVIFVHGVLGDSASTWTNSHTKAYWPKLLADDPDFASYDVYVYGYQSEIFSAASNLQEIAVRMGQQLKDRGVFKNYDQVFFITHSAGGIITKRMLDTLDTPAQNRLLKKVRCVLYISVPSNGSELAALATWLSDNPQFASLSPKNAADFLQAVETDWTELLRERTTSSPFPKTFVAYEKLPTKGVIVVPQLFSTQSDGPVIPFDKTHSEIVKPEDRNAEIYEWAKSRILEVASVKTETSRGDAANPKGAATLPASSTSKPQPPIQNCPGGICAGGDITGNPTIINPPPTSPKALWTEEQFKSRPVNISQPISDAAKKVIANPGTLLKLSVDKTLLNPRFFARCDRPCTPVHVDMPMVEGLLGGSMANLIQDASVAVLRIDAPNPLPSDATLQWDIRSNDDKPIHIVEMGIIPVQ